MIYVNADVAREAPKIRGLLESATILLSSSMEINSQILSNLATFAGICEHICTYTCVDISFEAFSFGRIRFSSTKRTVINISMRKAASTLITLI